VANPVYTIPQIANYLINEFWTASGGSAHHFNTSTITFNVQGLTESVRNLARQALQMWQEVCSITFQETTGSAQIRFDDTYSGAYCSANYSDGITTSAYVNVGQDWTNTYGTSTDSYSFQTLIHEIGHALGLGHAGPYNGSATYSSDAIYANDTWAYTIMSYFDQVEAGFGSYRFVMTPMLADIYAVQSLYGVAATRTGDTIYGFNTNAGSMFNFAGYSQAPALTIYDSGGTDTLDCSGYQANQRIDLTPGAFSNVGGLSGNIAIGTSVTIENAIGGSGHDTIIGNDANNILTGNAGNDTLYGGAGNDTLVGGAGIDNMFGGDGNDTIWYSVEDNIIDGGAGFDTARASTDHGITIRLDTWSIEQLFAGAGNDSIFTFGTSAIAVDGGAGNDSITGSVFGDTLSGNLGNDVIFGGPGNDIIGGGSGSDRICGGEGADILFGEANPDSFIYRGLIDAGDTIIGFETSAVFGSNGDRIEIYRDGFLRPDETNLGALDPNRFVAGQATLPTGQFLFDTNTGNLFWDGDGTGAGLPTFLLQVQNVNNLSANDFLVV
jgi:serralysin